MALAARIAAAMAVVALTFTAVTSARADDLVRPKRLDVAPEGYRMTPNQATAVADRVPKVIAVRRRYPGSFSNVFEKSGLRWQVSYYSAGTSPKEIAQVYVSDDTGKVTEAYTGFKVAWTMARGYGGAFGRKVNSPWVWIPLTILFIVPFVDPRRPLRMRHLDLLVLSAFGISVAFFNDAQITVSVPLAYPLLAYLLGRMLWVGLRRSRRPDPLRLLVPASWLAIALVFLIGFRIGLNVADSNVIDVGYAGVIGADRMTHGERVYGNFPSDNPHGDTYGPIAYAAYIPFEQIWPWSGTWNDLPAAHGAAVVFDLLCLGLLLLIGWRLRGPPLGIALAYAWAAYPFTLYALECNVNDALVAALVLAAIAAAAKPGRRGLFIALAGMTKFAPLGLAPLMATHSRGAVRYTLGLATGLAACAALIAVYGGPHAFFDRTLAFQAGRDSPFSIWGLYGWNLAQGIVQMLTIALALAVAFVPRRRDLVGLCALSAAMLLAVQLGTDYWFYLYIVWFFGPLMIGLLGDEEPAPVQPRPWSIDELARLPSPAVAWR